MKERRNKGEGSIQDLGNGKYKVVITAGKGIDGKQRRKCATVIGRKAALEKLAEFKLRYSAPEQVIRETKAQITFKAYVEKWLELKEISTRNNTVKSYHKVCEHMLSDFGSLKMCSITTAVINEYFFNKLKEGFASSSLNLHKVILTSIFKSAIHDDVIAKNPVTGSMRLPKRERKVDIALPSEDQVKALLAKAKELQGTKGYFAHLYPLCLLLVSTGLRRGEVVNLKWDWIDFKNSRISIKAQTTIEGTDRPLKSDSARRTIYVAPDVLRVLNEIPKVSPFVFVTTRLQPITLSCLNESFALLFRSMGLQIRPHDLRHYHATTLLSHGVNIKAVSQRLGHSSITTTLNLYVHHMPEVDETASNVIGASYVL